MAVDIGPKIGIDGEKEFRESLRTMGQQLKTLGTEMKAVTSAFDVDNDSQKKLAAVPVDFQATMIPIMNMMEKVSVWRRAAMEIRMQKCF